MGYTNDMTMTSTIPTVLRSLVFTATTTLILTSGALATEEPGELPLDELRTFADVFSQIRVGYVEEIDDRTLLEYAIQGMLSGLDPHSVYLTADDFEDLQSSTSGEFSGLGLEVGMDNGFVTVISPIDDTPAFRAGMLGRLRA